MLMQLQQDSPLLVALFDPQDRLQHANGAFLRAYPAAPALGRHWVELVRAAQEQAQGEFIEADDFDAWLAAAQARRGKLPFRAYEMELRDGRSLWMTETLHASGWLMMLGSDVTALMGDAAAGRSRRTPAQPELDATTGLRPRRASLRQLQRTLASDQAWPICLALLAIDGDAAGQPLCRRDLAEQIQASIRQEDGSGLLAENEYLLILPTAGIGQGRAIVERLLQRTRQAALGYRCSAGIVQAHWGEGLEALTQRLNDALAAARSLGGDRVEALDD